MTTPQDRIKNLEDELARLKADLEAPKPPSRWVPRRVENYWYVNQFGYIEGNQFNTTRDEERIKTGNAFKTAKEAEAAIPRFYTRLVAMQKLRDAAKGFKPDWRDSLQRKFHLYHSCISEEWQVTMETQTRRPGAVYFKSEGDCKNALKSLTKDELNSLLED